MAATTAGALKALVEAGGLSLAAYRDEAPDGAAMPYVVILEGVSIVPHTINNRFKSDKQVREQAQLTLWQRYRDPADNSIDEDYTLAGALERLVDGAALPASPRRTWAVFWNGSVRFPPNRDINQVQTVITVELIRDL